MKTHTSKTAIWLRSLVLLPLIGFMVYGFSEKKDVLLETPLEAHSTPEKALEEIHQKGASKAQLAEYNKLAKHYSTMKEDNMVIKIDDIKRLKYLYGLMTEEQKDACIPFPSIKIPPPPPPPAKDLTPEERTAYKQMEARARAGKSYSWEYTNAEGKPVKVIANHLSDSIPPPPPPPVNKKSSKAKKASKAPSPKKED